MRVLIIADPLDNQRAGIHVYLRELVKQLASRETEHEYILVRERVDPDLPLQQVAMANTRLPIGYASFRLFVLIPRLARKLRVDAVFEPAHFGPFNLPRSIKRITMIHDLTPILFGRFHRFHSQLLQKIFLRGILKRTDLVLANSHHTARDLGRVYPFTAGKTEMIHLGRDERFRPVATRTFLEEHGIEKPYFLFVGTIEPRKNVTALLTAYARLRDECTRAIDLVIVGQRGWKSKAFFERLEAHPYRDDIYLPGFIPFGQLLEAYSHSLALVYPSIYEGFGFPILEALACGTNVICPDNSSLPEVGGELAYYYPTEDVGALVALLQRFAAGDDEIEQRRKLGPQWAATFSWKKYVDRFEAVLTKSFS